MTKDELLELADRCEREEANRPLEIAIWKAVGLIDEAHCAAWCAQNGRTDLTRERYIAAWAPNFCVSLDAAVTLVPEGWVWLRKSEHTMTCYQPPANDEDWAVHFDANAHTPALALCAAALRARASLTEKE